MFSYSPSSTVTARKVLSTDNNKINKKKTII